MSSAMIAVKGHFSRSARGRRQTHAKLLI